MEKRKILSIGSNNVKKKWLTARKRMENNVHDQSKTNKINIAYEVHFF